MKLKLFLFFASLAIINFLQAQTLFTYGTYTVSKKEFSDAYNKNPDTTGNRAEKLKEYLDLYVNFRLKLQAAFDEKANNNADLKSEGENFKSQLTENFINQQADVNQLLHESFLRSQKDILVQQVFVKIDGNDTATAYAQISKAYNELKSGKNFDDAAVEYSSDTSIKAAKGYVGYITVFTLPYSIESTICNLKPGDFSNIYKSKAGYHIFKNVSERKALGRRKIEQMLFATPSFLNNEQQDSVKHIADSVYNLLQSGTSFAALLPGYGRNYSENQNADIIEVSVGNYSSDFEEAVFSLTKVGDISKPFKTGYGYNIIKLDEILPVSSDENDVTFIASLQTQIQNDDRLSVAKANLIDKWLGITGFKEASYNHNDVWAYTDSALKTTKLPALYKGIKPETVLFRFTKKNITVKDWIVFLKGENLSQQAIAQLDFDKQIHNYTRIACDSYYRDNIEDFDTAATAQIKEFSEANMLFYVMDKHVWGKASSDTTGLKKYYNEHKSDYTWKQSITALVLSAPNKETADTIAERIKNNPSSWHHIVSEYNGLVYADSNRFEIDQLPVKQKISIEKGFQTTPEANDAGGSYTFVHVLQIYPQPESRSFEEAKGIMINDYQQQLENTWIASLKKKYPVKINTTIFNSLQ